MLCENCKKNTATTHIKRTINGNTQEYHLCSECAKALGMTNRFRQLYELRSWQPVRQSVQRRTYGYRITGNGKRCPGCGISFDDIAKPDFADARSAIPLSTTNCCLL